MVTRKMDCHLTGHSILRPRASVLRPPTRPVAAASLRFPRRRSRECGTAGTSVGGASASAAECGLPGSCVPSAGRWLGRSLKASASRRSGRRRRPVPRRIACRRRSTSVPPSPPQTASARTGHRLAKRAHRPVGSTARHGILIGNGENAGIPAEDGGGVIAAAPDAVKGDSTIPASILAPIGSVEPAANECFTPADGTARRNNHDRRRDPENRPARPAGSTESRAHRSPQRDDAGNCTVSV